MRSVAVVTTCNLAGYQTYGRRMIRSLEAHWPREVPIYAYNEGFEGEIISDRIIHRDLLTTSQGLAAFKARHADNPAAHGKDAPPTWRFDFNLKTLKFRIRRKPPQQFLRDAVRFSHKSFAIFEAARNCQHDLLIWLDADTCTFADISMETLQALVPENCLAGYLWRPRHSECGLVAYNLRHPAIKDFLKDFERMYTEDTLFDEKQWHDSYLFDLIRKKYQRGGCQMHDIGGGVGRTGGDVFAKSWLSQYIVHAKGTRKFDLPKTAAMGNL